MIKKDCQMKRQTKKQIYTLYIEENIEIQNKRQIYRLIDQRVDRTDDRKMQKYIEGKIYIRCRRKDRLQK